mgnify:CR=1 FL=1
MAQITYLIHLVENLVLRGAFERGALVLDAEVLADGDYGPHRHEAHTEQHRHADPDVASDSERLEERRNSTRKQIGADQKRLLALTEAERISDEEWHRDRARIHRQHVLQAEEQEESPRQALIDSRPLRSVGRAAPARDQ